MTDREVLFRRVPPTTPDLRDKFWQLILVANTGPGELHIDEIAVEGEEDVFRVQYPVDPNAEPDTDADAPPAALASGETFSIRVFFNPDISGKSDKKHHFQQTKKCP